MEIKKKQVSREVLKARRLIDSLERAKFYGTLELNFQNGKITHGKKRESFVFSPQKKVL